MAQSSANHREACRQGGSYMTYDGTKDVERHVAAVFVRRTSTGSLEAYIPSFFGDAQRQMEQAFKRRSITCRPDTAAVPRYHVNQPLLGWRHDLRLARDRP